MLRTQCLGNANKILQTTQIWLKTQWYHNAKNETQCQIHNFINACWCKAKGNANCNSKHVAIALLLSKTINGKSWAKNDGKKGNGGNGRTIILPFTGS